MRWHVAVKGGLVLGVVVSAATAVTGQVGGRVARHTLGRAAAEGIKDGAIDKATGGGADALRDAAVPGGRDMRNARASVKDAVEDKAGTAAVAVNATPTRHDQRSAPDSPRRARRQQEQRR